MVTRLSTAAISRSNGNVPSIDPSSTSTISKVSPLASITDLSRAYKSVTFSCSLWSGTTIEYLSTVSFDYTGYYTGTRRRFAVTSVRREADGLEARFRSLRVVFRRTCPERSRRGGIRGCPILVRSFSRVGFHDCRFRGQGGPLASPMFTTCYPHTPSPLLMKSWAWREFFASVFESKGLIGKVFQGL